VNLNGHPFGVVGANRQASIRRHAVGEVGGDDLSHTHSKTVLVHHHV
jgi:hypothetical protein